MMNENDPGNRSGGSASATLLHVARVEARIKRAFSAHHLRCACYCTKHCKRVEGQHIDGRTPEENSSLLFEDIAYASGAILSSVAFLEASANELFCHIRDGSDHCKSIDAIARDIMLDKWPDRKKKKRNQAGLVGKFNIIAQAVTSENLPEDDISVRDVRAIVALRNALTHFQPEWQQVEPACDDDPYGLNALRDHFPPNPFATTEYEFFPYECLGAGCARWALFSAVEFRKKFFDAIEITQPKGSQEIIRELME